MFMFLLLFFVASFNKISIEYGENLLLEKLIVRLHDHDYNRINDGSGIMLFRHFYIIRCRFRKGILRMRTFKDVDSHNAFSI